MTLFFADLVREASWGTGTGDLPLGGALPGHRSFADAVPPGARFHYCIAGVTWPEEWETGEGEIGSGGTLIRLPLASSAGGSIVGFSAGLKTVALTVAADWFAARDEGIADIDDVVGLPAALESKLPAAQVSAFGSSLIDDSDAATARTTLGLGTAATQNVGSSGAAVPLLNAANSWGADQIVNGRAVGAGGETGSTVVGGSLSAGATNAIAIGSGASVSATSGVAIGRLATASGSAVAIGESSNAVANGIAIGRQADCGGFTSLVFARGATATANSQIVFGSANVAYHTMFIGRGATHSSAVSAFVCATGGSGIDVAAGDLHLRGGASTGSAAPGSVVVQTTTAGVSGATAQSWSTRVTFTGAAINMASGVALQANGTQVVASRRTGWGSPTGTAIRAAFDTATVTTGQLAERVKALIDDLRAHGLIGS